jgi:phage terminase large subunit-like protein
VQLPEEDKIKRLYKLQQMELRQEAPTNFASFLKYTIPKYHLKWFHRVIAEYCQMLYEGRIKNLMVFIAPQHGKSEIVSRNFPAWALGCNPNLKIIGCSYSSILADGFSTSIQRTINNEKYQTIFSETTLNGTNGRYVRGYKRNEDYFDILDYRGFYKAVGVGGSLTGTPADIAIIDDPVKDAMEAYSQNQREKVWDWYTSVLMTRLHNESRQLFIMTRWHEDDLAGRILKYEPQNWTVLKIPAIRETLDDGNDFDPRQVGEPLWPERHSLERLLAAKSRSAKVFSALYQQSPTIEGGNIIRESWFKYITLEAFNSKRQGKELEFPIVFFIDTAFTEKTTNDPTGIIGVCCIDGILYITCAEKVNMKFPDLVRHIPVYVKSNGYNRFSSIRIEPKANGISVIDQLEELTNLNVVSTPSPRESKETRLNAASPFVESGKVCIVQGLWNGEFTNEVCGFPAMPHDEFVDLLCYAINYCHSEADDITDDEIMKLGFL